MKTVIKKRIILPAASLLLILSLLPLSAQKLPSADRLARRPDTALPARNGEAGSIITVDRPVLTAWDEGEGGEDGLNPGGGNTDKDGDVVDGVPVTGGAYLLIGLVILYAFGTRMTRMARMNADRHCEGGSVARYEAKQSSGTQMTQITRMNANLYNKRICADLRHLRHLRSKRANTQVRPYNFQIFKSSNNKL